MRLGEFFSRLDRLAEFYYTINDQMRRVAEDVKRLDAALAEVRGDLSTLKAEVAALQEACQTLRAELRAVIAETVAALGVAVAQLMGEGRREIQVDAADVRRELSRYIGRAEREGVAQGGEGGEGGAGRLRLIACLRRSNVVSCQK